jgi:drug/metabolite transporter (DMT)-like permease
MHPTVLLLGLLSALLAGVADFFAALVSRKLGSFATLSYMIASSALLLVLGQVFWFHENLLSLGDTALMFLIAAAAVVGYLAFSRGLALGPVAVVSPIAACDGAVAALLGIALIGEHLVAAHYAAIGLLVLGVALAATDLGKLKEGLGASGKGPLLALVTMIGFGIAIAGLAHMAGQCRSFLPPLLTLRCCILIQLATVGGAMRHRLLSGAGIGALLAAAGVGLLDTGSLLALAQGMIVEQSAKVALLGPLYGAYPVVTVLLAQVFLREKLVANQGAGMVLAMTGTILLVAIKGG